MSEAKYKTLALIKGQLGREERRRRRELERSDEYPRASLFEDTIHADIIDEHLHPDIPRALATLYRKLPAPIPQLMEAYRLRRKYDALIAWAEIIGMPLAGIFKATHQRIPLVGIFSWISKPKKARVLKRVWSSFDKIILMSTVQYRCAREMLQIPEDRLALLRWPVDLKFWRPMDIVPDKICAVGREMRDYGTLLQAMEGLPLHCHIAANAQPGVKDQWIQTLADPVALPPNVSVGAKNYKELRNLYAQSRFVVVPLHPTDTDNGTTSVLEAMAMGKAVICSRVEGQHGVIQEGKTGFFVPPEDPRALRSAMESLLTEPEKAEAMGREGRQWVERHHSLDTWVTQVKDIVDAVVETHRRKMDV